MRKWSAIAQDFAGAASAVLVVTALTSNLNKWPTDKLDRSVVILFAAIAAIFLVKMAVVILATEPRRHYRFRRPKPHRLLDDIWGIGRVVKWVGLDAPSAKARMDENIRKWMLRELGYASSAVIFTRDLSWARVDDEVMVALAKRGDLRIISCAISHGSDQLADLKRFVDLGARVDHWKVEAPARFTLFKREGNCKVAVALPDKKQHLIVVTDDPEDGLFRLAMGVVSAIDGAKVRSINGV